MNRIKKLLSGLIIPSATLALLLIVLPTTNYCYAQGDEPPPVVIALVVMVGGLIFLASFGLQVYLIYLTYQLLEALPPPYRRQEPGMVWLCLLPLFNYVWNFFVFPKIAESYQAYFYAQGNYHHGDCGAQLAQWYCICVVLTMLPCVGAIAGIGALITLIMFLIKGYEMKQSIQAGAFHPSPFAAKY